MIANSSIGEEIEAGEINIPPPRHQEECSFDPLPYYLLGEEIPQNLAYETLSW